MVIDVSKEKKGQKKDNKQHNQPSGGKKKSGVESTPVLSTDGHECMRTGLASVMSTLDDMLDGMKKI